MQSFLSDDDNINYFGDEGSWLEAEELTQPQGSGGGTTVFHNTSYKDDDQEEFEMGRDQLLQGRAGAHKTSNF